MGGGHHGHLAKKHHQSGIAHGADTDSSAAHRSSSRVIEKIDKDLKRAEQLVQLVLHPVEPDQRVVAVLATKAIKALGRVRSELDKLGARTDATQALEQRWAIAMCCVVPLVPYAADDAATSTDMIPETSKEDADCALQAAADILKNGYRRLIDGAPERYIAALYELHGAASGNDGKDAVNGRRRREWFVAAKLGLAPAIALYRTYEGGDAWIAENLQERLTAVDTAIADAEVRDRVAGSVRIGEHQTIEVPDGGSPREQAGILRLEIGRVVPMIGSINEHLIRLGHDGIHHEAKELFEGEITKTKFGPGNLADLQKYLLVLDGYLGLTDEEFTHHLEEVRGACDGVSTFAELVKYVVELLGGSLCLLAACVGRIGKALGAAGAEGLIGASRLGVLTLGNVVALAELIHGVFTLLDSSASRQERLDGAVDATSATAWIARGAFEEGAKGAASMAIAIRLGYLEFKVALAEFWATAVGIEAGYLCKALETVAQDGEEIATAADALARCQDLARDEPDAGRAAAFRRVEAEMALGLGRAVDDLISECMPRKYEAGVAAVPGSQPLLVELFASLQSCKGTRTADAAASAAQMALARITWALRHAPDLVEGSTAGKGLAEVQQTVDAAAKSVEGEDQ